MAKPVATSEFLAGGRPSPKQKINQDLSDIYRETFLQASSGSAVAKAVDRKSGPVEEKDLRRYSLMDQENEAAGASVASKRQS